MKIPDIFAKCQSVIMSKRQDYTTNPDIDNHENFKRSSEIASWFKDDQDKSYAVLIGTKLARLGSLLSSGREPNNETVEDSFLDLINYCSLWLERRTEIQPETIKLIKDDMKRGMNEITRKLNEPGKIIPVDDIPF